jgi:hypothetical protein
MSCVQNLYIRFVYISNCVCVYNFRPVDPWIIQHVMNMATTSKTDIKLSYCPFKESCTL